VIDFDEPEGKAPHQKTRLVIAAFTSNMALCTALAELERLGLVLEQIAIAALDEAMARFLRHVEGDACAAIGPCTARAEATTWTTPQGAILATRPELWARLAAVGPNPLTHHRDGFVDEIGRGALVLLVSSTSFAQQRRAVRVLLRHGQSRVSTHEFRSRSWS
jgi:hypothetical protein